MLADRVVPNSPCLESPYSALLALTLATAESKTYAQKQREVSYEAECR